MGFTYEQVLQLLLPINPRRVLKDGKGFSHVSQQDITAHLIRCFGFGNFDTQLTSCELVYEDEHKHPTKAQMVWDACYRASMRISIRDPEGNHVATYEDASTGEAQNQPKRFDAHDLAMKSAISLAKKRATINLGDQFGLSLYNKGQMTALVLGTRVMPTKSAAPTDAEAPPTDVQDGVPEQVSLGVDEKVYSGETAPTSPEHNAQLSQSLGHKPKTAE